MAYHVPTLVVDDDPAIAEILQRAAKSNFPEASFTPVRTIDDALSYLENLEGKDPKHIVMDINLESDGEGLGFLSPLRSHPQGRLVPTIMLSASESSHQIREAYELGATSFTSKPYCYTEWKDYLSRLRIYWYETVSLPGIWFEKIFEPLPKIRTTSPVYT
ncbi:response regulator [Spirosoma endbachense]|uniref:Response regulator n=1 Tax=Spirosoma endbachense TaxID=2666025 RepID=A0A6P1VL29_9BACT|nr:response regulator [Spirosoma endbachense]QHV93763.1 response regulator [Spirosoma endbachense]